MNKTVRLTFLTIIIISLGCSSSIRMLPEPVEKGNLLIGSMIFDIDRYQDRLTTLWDDIEIAIIGQYVENGELKYFRQWAITDENGYFFIANVPDGEYAIKGFKVRLFGDEELKVVNELTDPQKNYYELTTEHIISFHGSLFDVRQKQRIINFQHSVFTLYQNGIVDLKRYDRLQQLKLSTGETLNSPPVPFYFVDNYSESSWTSYLNLLLK